MSRNGSGVYSLPAGNPVVTGTTISSTWANTTLSDISTALTGSVASDGQTAMTGNLQMGNNKVTGLAVATSSGDALSFGQAATISALTVTGAFAANGGATLGDGSGDALTINSSAVSIPNGLNFDSNTLVIDATNNRVGVGTASPSVALDISSGNGRTTAAWQVSNNGIITSYTANTTGSLISNDSVAPIIFSPNNTERMRIDSSGNVGIGTSSTAARLHVAGTGNQQVLIQSTNGNSPSIQLLSSGVTAWNLENSTNALKFLQDGSERMRIDGSGNVGIGTSSFAIANRLNVKQSADNSAAGYGLRVERNSNDSSLILGYRDSTDTWQINATYGTTGAFKPISFHTADTERMRITSGGNVLVGTTTQRAAEFVSFTGTPASGGWMLECVNNRSSATANGILIYYPNFTPNNTTNPFLQCVDGAGNPRFEVRSNGGIANYSANNVNLSDAREKTNVELAGSYLEKVCAIPIKTFNYIDQNLEEDDGLTLGVIAQDVQAVAPELVSESNWGTPEEPKMRLSIYQTDLQYALMKCIQEQQAIIQSQSDTITAMEARLTALESK